MYRYCPRCGSPYPAAVVKDTERTTYPYSSCALVFYNNPKPSVNAIILDPDGKLLLGRRKIEPDKGRWGLPGGFIAWTEEPEQALVRELREELGVAARIGPILGVYREVYHNHGRADEAYNVLVMVYRAWPEDFARISAGDDVSEIGTFPPDALPKLAFRNQGVFFAENFGGFDEKRALILRFRTRVFSPPAVVRLRRRSCFEVCRYRFKVSNDSPGAAGKIERNEIAGGGLTSKVALNQRDNSVLRGKNRWFLCYDAGKKVGD